MSGAINSTATMVSSASVMASTPITTPSAIVKRTLGAARNLYATQIIVAMRSIANGSDTTSRSYSHTNG